MPGPGWEGTDHRIPDPAGCSFKRTEVPLVYQQRLRKRHIKRQPGRNVWENKGWHGLRNGRDLKGRDRMDVYRKSLYRSPWSSNHKGLETVLRKLKEQGLKRVYECYDMDKMMELSCKHDEKSACRQCEHGIHLYHGECPKKRRKRDMIRKGCIKLYEICEELNVSCKRVTWDTDASGTWMEHYKGVDDWILRKEEKGNWKTA